MPDSLTRAGEPPPDQLPSPSRQASSRSGRDVHRWVSPLDLAHFGPGAVLPVVGPVRDSGMTAIYRLKPWTSDLPTHDGGPSAFQESEADHRAAPSRISLRPQWHCEIDQPLPFPSHLSTRGAGIVMGAMSTNLDGLGSRLRSAVDPDLSSSACRCGYSCPFVRYTHPSAHM